LEIDKAPSALIMVTVYGLALLMVSNIPYRSFKNIDLARHKSFHMTLGVILFAFVVVQFPYYMLFAIAVAFVVHGPVEFWWATRDKSWRDKLFLATGWKTD
jgi:CDP-diacylglycerol--serine O-phosphatidyltransferase